MSEEFTTLPDYHDKGFGDINQDIAAALRQHDADIKDVTMHGRHEPPTVEPYLEYMTPDGPATMRQSDSSSQDAGEEAAQETADASLNSEAEEDDELAAQPPAVREILESARKQFDADLERETGAPAEHRGATEPFDAALAPFRPYLASLGVTPGQAAQRLLSVEYRLRNGTPEQKTQMLAQLAKDYGIAVSEMADEDYREPMSPEMVTLSRRLGGIEQAIWADRQRLAQQIEVEARSVVDEFAAATDAAGKLAHPHFEQVRDEMARLMTSFPEMDINAAYDSAVWSNSKVRQDMLAKQRRAAAPKKSGNAGKQAKGKGSNLTLRGELRKQLKLAEERIR